MEIKGLHCYSICFGYVAASQTKFSATISSVFMPDQGKPSNGPKIIQHGHLPHYLSLFSAYEDKKDEAADCVLSGYQTSANRGMSLPASNLQG